MRNYRLIVEYDGTNYHGFQVQNNHVTIQGCLEAAISEIASEPTRLISAGRTDARVHAYNQVVNFKSNLTVPINKLPVAINQKLPSDIRVKHADLVSLEFNARYEASSKTYLYQICQGEIESVFYRNYAWWIKPTLDVELMRQAGKHLEGTNDFIAFAASGSSVKTTTRTIYDFSLEEKSGKILLSFTADGFLYKMVRNMVGTLVEIGLGKRQADSIPEILLSKNREKAGITAPPQGLFLKNVDYKF